MNPTRPDLRPCPHLQSVQHEYTNVLACLVKTFPSKKDFRDLVQLTNYSDPESDFFEHMKHIQVSVEKHLNAHRRQQLADNLTRFLSVQIHRRGRALRKLAKQLCDGHVMMTPRSLQNYIMPFAMTALLDEKMLKVTSELFRLQRFMWNVCGLLTVFLFLFLFFFFAP